MQFSVIVPNLHSPVIDRTLQALEGQTFDHHQFEVIVVGMDSHGLVKESSLVRFDRSERPLSPAQARNRGAVQAKGEILAFTDADCLPRPDWLEILAGRFAEPGVTVVGGGVEFDTANFWTMADNLSMFHEYLTILPAGERRQLASLNLAIRKMAFEKVGGFDERYPRAAGEDADLTIRLRKAGHQLLFEPRAVVFHAPARYRLVDLLRHSFYQGMYSTKVDPRYWNEEGLSGILHSRLGLVIFAPFLAVGATVRVMLKPTILGKYGHTMPIIFLSKLVWCLGAARRGCGG